MDSVGLATLQAELEADRDTILDAVALAEKRFGSASPPELEACAFQLVRVYNAFEQMGLRVTKAFENHIDDERGWHTELVRRLALTIPGVRPAFIPERLVPYLQEVRGFRHVVVHAYDFRLHEERLRNVLEAAKRIASQCGGIINSFFATVRNSVG